MALVDSPLDRIARGLAGGMSRREALRAGGAALVGAAAITPADAIAAVTGHCPHHRVRCQGKCCPAGEVCLPPKHKGAKRHCGCPHHRTRCGGKCVDLHSNHHNCGRCGHICASGQHCSAGHCVSQCPAGQTVCAGTCVNLGENPQHCGACGTACPSGSHCVNGKCTHVTCPPGQATCAGVCVDQMTNAKACGPNCVDCTTLAFVTRAHCANGTCVIDQCAPDWVDCDHNPLTGCETLGTTC